MKRIGSLGLALGLALLAGCDDEPGDNSATNVSISDESGNAVFSADAGSGKVAIDVPGLKGSISLPKIKLGGGDVDIDGVKLYPGSTVSTIDVRSNTKSDEGQVKIAFEVPQAPDVVRAYYLDAFKAKGVTVTAQGNGLSGTQKDGDPFSIDLSAGGAGTKGVIHLGKPD